jgi:aspartyl protease family protein
MRNILFFAGAALATALLVPKAYEAKKPAAESARAATATTQPAPAQQNYRTATISRSSNGHFMTDAVVDGRRIDFLVDTGASTIALKESDAARLGIHPAERDYTVGVSTANGVARAARVSLNRVEVGGVMVRDVSAIVMPDEALGQNLLGMSFLSRLRWEQRNGRLILEQ